MVPCIEDTKTRTAKRHGLDELNELSEVGGSQPPSHQRNRKDQQKMKTLATVTVLAALIAAPAIAADFEDGKKFTQNCQSKEDGPAKLSCFVYARGVADGLAIMSMAAPQSAVPSRMDAVVRSCIPEKTATRVLVNIGLRYMQEYPQKQSYPASMLLAFAFAREWPCNTSH
jgi:Rap1a immunity proteins